MTTILAATAALTVLASEGFGRLGDGGGGEDQVVRPPDATATTSTTAGQGSTEVPSSATRVTGTVTALHLELAAPEPRRIAAPFTITADRGFGNGGRITGVTVEGTAATIEWDAGRPFVISSGAALVLDPVRIDLAPEGRFRLNLADGVHAFEAGTYHLDTPVAVGSSGVASPRETVVFDATTASRFEPRGDAALFLDANRARQFLGPGTIHLEGTFELTDAAGTRAVTRVDGAEVPFDIVLTPVAGGGWTIDGRVGGKLTTA
jgi:hypothetical protein